MPTPSYGRSAPGSRHDRANAGIYGFTAWLSSKADQIDFLWSLAVKCIVDPILDPGNYHTELSTRPRHGAQ